MRGMGGVVYNAGGLAHAVVRGKDVEDFPKSFHKRFEIVQFPYQNEPAGLSGDVGG